ncbi:SMP-30/gluconolactonase/LRE family protein [Thalassotalea piscium]
MTTKNLGFIGIAMAIFSVVSIGNASEVDTSVCNGNAVPIIDHSKLTRIGGKFLFLEGPTWSVRNEAFYFSEMNFNGSQQFGPKSTLYKLSLPNHISVYEEDSGTNGLLAVDDFIYTMNHATRSLSRISTALKTKEIIVDHYKGLKFNSPNDLVQGSNGTLYFTDPNWQLSGRNQETKFTGVYSVTREGKLTLLEDSLNQPNGIALSPDENTLYIGSLNNGINRYEIDNQGNVGKKEAFVTITSPDGMAIDCAGNLYVASHTEGVVYIYSNEGKILNKIDLGPKVTNVAFGGSDLKTLLITTDHGLYTLAVNIPGLQLNSVVK